MDALQYVRILREKRPSMFDIRHRALANYRLVNIEYNQSDRQTYELAIRCKNWLLKALEVPESSVHVRDWSDQSAAFDDTARMGHAVNIFVAEETHRQVTPTQAFKRQLQDARNFVLVQGTIHPNPPSAETPLDFWLSCFRRKCHVYGMNRPSKFAKLAWSSALVFRYLVQPMASLAPDSDLRNQLFYLNLFLRVMDCMVSPNLPPLRLVFDTGDFRPTDDGYRFFMECELNGGDFLPPLWSFMTDTFHSPYESQMESYLRGKSVNFAFIAGSFMTIIQDDLNTFADKASIRGFMEFYDIHLRRMQDYQGTSNHQTWFQRIDAFRYPASSLALGILSMNNLQGSLFYLTNAQLDHRLVSEMLSAMTNEFVEEAMKTTMQYDNQSDFRDFELVLTRLDAKFGRRRSTLVTQIRDLGFSLPRYEGPGHDKVLYAKPLGSRWSVLVYPYMELSNIDFSTFLTRANKIMELISESPRSIDALGDYYFNQISERLKYVIQNKGTFKDVYVQDTMRLVSLLVIAFNNWKVAEVAILQLVSDIMVPLLYARSNLSQVERSALQIILSRLSLADTVIVCDRFAVYITREWPLLGDANKAHALIPATLANRVIYRFKRLQENHESLARFLRAWVDAMSFHGGFDVQLAPFFSLVEGLTSIYQHEYLRVGEILFLVDDPQFVAYLSGETNQQVTLSNLTIFLVAITELPINPTLARNSLWNPRRIEFLINVIAAQEIFPDDVVVLTAYISAAKKHGCHDLIAMIDSLLVESAALTGMIQKFNRGELRHEHKFRNRLIYGKALITPRILSDDKPELSLTSHCVVALLLMCPRVRASFLERALCMRSDQDFMISWSEPDIIQRLHVLAYLLDDETVILRFGTAWFVQELVVKAAAALPEYLRNLDSENIRTLMCQILQSLANLFSSVNVRAQMFLPELFARLVVILNGVFKTVSSSDEITIAAAITLASSLTCSTCPKHLLLGIFKHGVRLFKLTIRSPTSGPYVFRAMANLVRTDSFGTDLHDNLFQLPELRYAITENGPTFCAALEMLINASSKKRIHPFTSWLDFLNIGIDSRMSPAGFGAYLFSCMQSSSDAIDREAKLRILWFFANLTRSNSDVATYLLTEVKDVLGSIRSILHEYSRDPEISRRAGHLVVNFCIHLPVHMKGSDEFHEIVLLYEASVDHPCKTAMVAFLRTILDVSG